MQNCSTNRCGDLAITVVPFSEVADLGNWLDYISHIRLDKAHSAVHITGYVRVDLTQ